MGFVFLLHASAFPADTGDLLEGKWVARAYLDFGIEDGKLSKIPQIILRPEHFGMFMYTPTQTLEIKLLHSKSSSFERQSGIIKSNQKILDPKCSSVEAYKETLACTYVPGKELNANFRVFDLDSEPLDDHKVFAEAFKKSEVFDVNKLFMIRLDDYSAHLGFLGEKHILLRSNYYEKALKDPADSLKWKCPPGNRCWIVFLRFDKVTDSKSPGH